MEMEHNLAAHEENLAAFLRTEGDRTDKMILALAWYAGLTAAQCAALKWAEVDEDADCLRVEERTVPLSQPLAQLLAELEQKGPYVIHSIKAKNGATTRESVLRKARQALNAAGLPEYTLNDLRGAYILRLLKERPVEEASVITGYEVRTLQQFAKEQGAEISHPKQAEKTTNFTAEQLRAALRREGDILDTRIVWLSWQGGLSAKEMAGLDWEHISLADKTWQIGETVRPIGKEMLQKLREWSGSASPTGPLLRGKRSGRRANHVFLIKRGEEFFVRNQMTYTRLIPVQGRGSIAPKVLEAEISSLIEDAGRMGYAAIRRMLPAPERALKDALESLLQAGKIRKSEESGQYLAPGIQTDWERVEAVLAAYRTEGKPLTLSALAREVDIKLGSAGFYLQRAEERGLVEKVGRGAYRCL